MAEWQSGKVAKGKVAGMILCRELEKIGPIKMKYGEWMERVPKPIKDDPLWDIEVYRKSLFLSDLAWEDCDGMLDQRLGRPIAWQLLRSTGSISANIEEGFGRGFMPVSCELHLVPHVNHVVGITEVDGFSNPK